MRNYRVAVLKGNGIGPGIVEQAQRAPSRAAEKFGFAVGYAPALLGGYVIDTADIVLSQETIDICKASDVVLLGATGSSKWDVLPGNQRPETGLLGIREALRPFANLYSAIISKPLRGTSSTRPDIISSSPDLMVVHELTGGVCLGECGTR